MDRCGRLLGFQWKGRGSRRCGFVRSASYRDDKDGGRQVAHGPGSIDTRAEEGVRETETRPEAGRSGEEEATGGEEETGSA